MNMLATFHTHFGALSFQSDLKKLGMASKMMPVPRCLSSSCGTCVTFEGEFAERLVNEDMEAVYKCEGAVYSVIFEAEEN